MSSVWTISRNGVSVAGGGIFGNPGDNLLLDEDGDSVYTGVVTVLANDSSYYTYVNGPDWGGKENISDQDCANPENFNDRKLVWGSEDIVVNACFGLCGDGVCGRSSPSNFC